MDDSVLPSPAASAVYGRALSVLPILYAATAAYDGAHLVLSIPIGFPI